MVLMRRTDEEIARALSNHVSSGGFALPAVTVHVKDGWISLGGSVELPYQEKQAEYGLLDIPGVIGLHNNITNTKMPHVSINAPLERQG